jgi:hypothetical protein
MTNIIPPQSGRRWDFMYMQSLGVEIKDVSDYESFFGHPAPEVFQRQNVIDELLSYDLRHPVFNENTSDTVVVFIKCLLNVTDEHPELNSSVVDLGKELFNLLGFNRNPCISIHGPRRLKFLISEGAVEANPDIVIQNNRNMHFLVVQVDRSRHGSEGDEYTEAEPQLVAGMIGAFFVNVQKTEGKLRNQTMYGIVMDGTFCTFYKLHLTVGIFDEMTDGVRRDNPAFCLQRFRIGEKNPDFIRSHQNLLQTLKCFESIKKIIFESI